MSLVLSRVRPVTAGLPPLCDLVLGPERIEQIATPGAGRGDEVIDCGGAHVSAGFLDLEVTGAAGVDLTTNPQGISDVARALVAYGVTGFLPTIMSSAPEVTAQAQRFWRTLGGTVPGGARPIGLHLEGPFLSSERRGSHAEQNLRLPSDEIAADWSAEAGVAMVTLAPELPHALDLIADLTRRGVVVSLGHTDGSAHDVDLAVQAGARAVTHLFNGMSPLTHRDPGAVGGALDNDLTLAMIVDGHHIEPRVVRLVWRLAGPDRVMLVTNANSALGAERDATTAGGRPVEVRDGMARTDDGTLAGSLCPLNEAVRNLRIYTDCSLLAAVQTVTSTPADLLGWSDYGYLAPGHPADLAVFDSDLTVGLTVVGGRVVHRSL